MIRGVEMGSLAFLKTGVKHVEDCRLNVVQGVISGEMGEKESRKAFVAG